MPHQQLYNNTFTEQAAISNPKEFLQAVVNEYPYFSLAHFFLLKETASTDLNYRGIAAKTALHFNNPFLLRSQLNKKLKQEEKLNVAGSIPAAETIQKNALATDAQTLEAFDARKIANEPEETPGDQKAEVFKQSPVETHLEEIEKVDVNSAIPAATENPGYPEAGQKEIIADMEPEEKPGKKEELLFEPLHTSDYFASQGIKLSEEVQSGDKLGKQLRSFTDWLKTMKKVHHGKIPEATDIDKAVQNMAEKSNKEQEVLTEAMAEVYEQQGKMEKAAGIYRKLSLLNPSKSAYFAAKIELLKEN